LVVDKLSGKQSEERKNTEKEETKAELSSEDIEELQGTLEKVSEKVGRIQRGGGWRERFLSKLPIIGRKFKPSPENEDEGEETEEDLSISVEEEITVHNIRPGGRVSVKNVDDPILFEFDSAGYKTKPPFTNEKGEKLLIIDDGHPIPRGFRDEQVQFGKDRTYDDPSKAIMDHAHKQSRLEQLSGVGRDRSGFGYTAFQRLFGWFKKQGVVGLIWMAVFVFILLQILVTVPWGDILGPLLEGMG